MPERIVQVVAHQDDDTLFLNPDLQQSAKAGYDHVTVFLTAGDDNRGTEYAASRQDGALESHRHMAGVPACAAVRACWTQDTYKVGPGSVQRFTLNARPGVQLIFVNIFDGSDGDVDESDCDLAHLWWDTTNKFQATPMVPDETLDPTAIGNTRYTRATMINTLVGIFQGVKPTVIRTQDPHADARYFDGFWTCTNPGDGTAFPNEDYHDNYDHVSAARFTDAAAAIYTGPNNNGRIVVDHYRDYNILSVPANLSAAERDEKNATFRKYVPYDVAVQDERGDPGADYVAWGAAMYHRWPRGTSWVGKNADGTLQVFIIENGKILAWAQGANGAFTGPVTVGSPANVPLVESVSVAKDSAGRLQLFAVGADTNANVYVTGQSAPNGAWSGQWTSLGNPNQTIFAARKRMVSPPAVSANGDGRLQLFVTNGGGGISTKYQQANGTWTSSWGDMGGSDIQGQPAATTTNNGRIEMFASTTTKILHWYQSTPNAGFKVNNSLASGIPASPPTVGKNADGRLELFYRAAKTGKIADIYQTQLNGNWAGSRVEIAGPNGANLGGVAAPAVVNVGGPIMVFMRDGLTGVSVTRQKSANNGYDGVGWTSLGGQVIGSVAAGVESSGKAIAFRIGLDGKVFIARQTAVGADKPFGPWQAIETPAV